MYHQPTEGVLARRPKPEADGIWWPATPSSPPVAIPADPRESEHEAALEEIWETRGLVPAAAPRLAEEPTPEDIWGSSRRATDPNAPAAESIWEGLAEARSLPSPPPADRRPFALPDAWASSSRPRWRRPLDKLGWLNRRTG
jgi:hypothetical protein